MKIGREPAVLGLILGWVLMVVPAQAHHGFTGEYDANQPIYLAGRVIEARLAQPHALITVEVAEGLEVPSNSAVLARYDRSHGPALLENLTPWTTPGKVEILLEPVMTREVITRQKPAAGDVVEVIAFSRLGADGNRGELRVILLAIALPDGVTVLTAPRRSYHRGGR